MGFEKYKIMDAVSLGKSLQHMTFMLGNAFKQIVGYANL
jgi:hypothetical protein